MRTVLAFLISFAFLLPSTFAQHYKRFTLVGHRSGIRGMAYSPDGLTLATGAGDIRLWDASTLEHKRTLGGPGTRVTYSPDGRMLASGDYVGAVHVWDALTGEIKLKLEGHTSHVTSVAYSPDGLTIASGGERDEWTVDNTVRLWDALTGEHIRTLKGHTKGVTSIAYHPDGGTLASGSGDTTIRLWDAATGEHLKTIDGHHSAVLSVAFSPDGRTLASGGWDRTIRLWDAATGEPKGTLEGHTGGVASLAYGPDSRMLVSASEDKTVRHWDTLTGENKHTQEEPTLRVYAVAYSPDGRRFTSGNNGGTIRLWDAVTGAPIGKVEGHRSWVGSVAFSPDGSTLVCGYNDGVIRIWNVLTGALMRTLNPRTVGANGLWEAFTGLSERMLSAHTFAVTSIAYSPDGRMIATGSFDFIRLWDAATGEQTGQLEGHRKGIRDLAFSPDGRTLASGSIDATVRLWNLVTGVSERLLEGHRAAVNCVAYSHDGRILASGSADDTIRLWDALTGAPKQTLSGHRDTVNSVAFTPDGRTIASGGSNTVRLWDVLTGANTRTLKGYTGTVTSVAFSPDGHTLAAGSYDGAAHLWALGSLPDTSATVRITPAFVVSSPIGGEFTISLAISEGESVAGYQATVEFDASALRYVSSNNSDYLPEDALAVPSVVSGNKVTLAAASPLGQSDGGGTLATLTFEVIAVKASTLRLSKVILSDSEGVGYRPRLGDGEVAVPSFTGDANQDGAVDINDLFFIANRLGQTAPNRADVNGDGVVSIRDLVLVAAAIRNAAAAPPTHSDGMGMVTSTEVKQWLEQARGLNFKDLDVWTGIRYLESLLAVPTPTKTALLPNYPNPFNPETWIPYRLATDSEVHIAIYDSQGALVRRLSPGNQPAGFYTDRGKAAHWDGRNSNSESVPNGIYFYHFRTRDLSRTRRMIVVK
ncbi:MAG: cohesin domain-containing protein [Candidatus Poribacteria bacterium]|nr:cohesin domain-containing protein [Candidatus Poribacteria bacterium]MDE0503303.1 cohesin domain-containing protein [Candidatus Poribacteria bacterium]